MTQIMNALPDKHKNVIREHLSLPANAPVGFAETCNWADAVRDSDVRVNLDGDHENTESWHFINVDRRDKSVGKVDCLVGCLLVGLDIHMVMAKEATGLNRTLALLYLSHWIGDVHQPLHVSFADDRGGNALELSGVGCADMHGLWDTCMITKQNMSNAGLVSDLMKDLPSAATQQKWQQDSPETWANESLAISLDPKTLYCRVQAGTCNRTPLGADNKLALTNGYVVNNWPVLRLRMQKAAVRMAGVLKTVLGA